MKSAAGTLQMPNRGFAALKAGMETFGRRAYSLPGVIGRAVPIIKVA